MTVQAVVHEDLRAMLQRGRIHRHRCLVELHRFRGEGQRRQQQHRAEQFLDHVHSAGFHLEVTLSGSGLHLSSLEYQGISRKKPK